MASVGFCEKIFVEINGVKQGMFIEGKHPSNPVLLFNHGGPGMPEYFLTRSYPTGIEENFTVCYWEQRGAGLSFSTKIPPESITEEQLISDTIAVSNYLRERFGQAKIYLFGHCWGAYLGIQAAARMPELYKAFIGMAQINRQFESEKLAYKYMLDRYSEAGNKKMVRRLEKFPIPDMDSLPDAYRSLRDEAMHELGIGTMQKMKSVISGIFLATWMIPDYTIQEKINLWRGKFSRYSTRMWHRMMATDLTVMVRKLDLPVYFFHGTHDYTANYDLAKDFFKKLEAPLKGFYSFDQSAHSPVFEEPEKTLRILREDVLAGMVKLADIF